VIRRSSAVAGLVASAALLAIAVSQLGHVRWTNFGGVDEWLQLELNSRGIFSMPHSNRPLIMLWSLPGVLLTPYRFEGYRLVHFAYSTLAAWLTWLLVRRLEPGSRRLAFLAGAFSVAWAPLDMARLAVVQTVPNAGLTAVSLLAVILFVESWRAARPVLLAAGLLVAFCCVRSYEATFGLLLGAPLLLTLLPRDPATPSRRRLIWIAVWEAGLAIFALAVVLPAWRGGLTNVYQSEILRLDLRPASYLARLIRQLGFQLVPLIPADLSELAYPAVAIAGLVFAAAFLATGSAREAPQPTRRRLAGWALLGLAFAALGHSVLVASASISGPTRTQFLSGPGIAILLAAGSELLVTLLSGRARAAGSLALACAVMMVAAGHTLAMQREWDRISFYPRQRDCLRALERQAPALRPGTLLLLIDRDGTWPFALTFRHAARLVYGGAVTAHALGGDQLLYGAAVRPGGVRVTPWPMLARPWRERASDHGFEQVIVFRLSGGAVSLLEEWRDPQLPPLPAGAHYAPRATIVAASPVPGRRVLD
jgi:hypothetical protein